MNIIQALSDTVSEAYGSNHPTVGNLLVMCYGKPIQVTILIMELHTVELK
jgi:hypothetical protein